MLILDYFSPEIIRIIKHLIAAIGVFVFGKITIGYLSDLAIRPLVTKKTKDESRIKTITHSIRLIGNTILYIVILALLLRILGFSPASLLTGLGITGLIVGLGVQSLIRDIVAGIFILTEDQFDIGNTIAIGDIEGVVEKFTIRSVVIRTKNGICYIPHGNINSIINRSKK